mgnify:CR=1 FL=1
MSSPTSVTADAEQAEGGGTASAGPRAFLTDVESRVMEARGNGRTYQISVALPDGYGTEATWPVLYVTDANAEFGLAVETARLGAFAGEMPGLVVVGIGYPNPGQGFRASLTPRAFDLTPTCDPSASVPTGGAPVFLSFLRDELVPLIERDFSVSRTDRGLMGHSFGGLFATYALVAGAGLFGRFVIASPSIWWHDRSILAMEEACAASGAPMEARVFLAAGSLERTPAGVPVADDITGLAQRLHDRRYPGLEVECHSFDGEGHVSVIGAAFSRGLRAVYGRSAAGR